MRFLLGFSFLCFICLLGCAAGSGDDGSGDDRQTETEETSNPSEGRELRDFCGTHEPDQSTRANLASGFAQFLATHGSSRTLNQSLLKDATVEIPVLFHVISKGPSLEEGEATDESMASQIDVLNREFSGGVSGIGTPFRFRLAGIDRVRKPEWHIMSPGSQSELDAKGALHQGGAETLNIYLVTIEGNILGYTLLPVFVPLISDFDGIVMNFRTLPGGSLERYNTGNVVVHETGHWLGLLHTFAASCDTAIGDLVPDTPVELIPTKGEFCPVQRDTCPEIEGMDPVHNHMTYTVDSCRNEFTPDQVDFMLFNSFAFRGLPVL